MSEHPLTAAEREAAERSRTIIRSSCIGIGSNVLLSAFKAAVGAVTGSIAITLDAVNNLSDAMSSLITIIGTKLSEKKPDKEHPMGYGRIEYLSSAIVSAIVLYAGVTSLVESVKKIIHPSPAEYSVVSLVIVAVAILVKIVMGRYMKAQGKKVNSGALEASGADALMDAILSTSVLASALIFIASGLSLEPIVGAVISVFIIRSGIEMVTDTLNDIIGQRADPEMVKDVKRAAASVPEVRGAFDVTLNNYGPNRLYGSLHIELPDTMTVDQADRVTREVERAVLEQTGVVLTGVGLYSYNTRNPEVTAMRDAISARLLEHEWALKMHGFYVDFARKLMRFDVVISFDIDSREALAQLQDDAKELYPEYEFVIAADMDIS